RLAEPVDERLPIARRRDGHRGRAAELVDAGPRAVAGNLAEERRERLRVAVEGHEHERSPSVDAHRYQRRIVRSGRERSELASGGHLAQPSVEVVRPSVERTAELREAATRALAQRAAAVQTRVLERAEHAVVAAHDEHRQVAYAQFVVIAGVRDVVE